MSNKRSNVWIFFGVTYLISWLAWLPEVLSSKSVYDSVGLMVFYIIGGFGPTLAAFILTYIFEGKQGVKGLLKRGFNLKIKKLWYFPIFFLMPLVLIIGLGIQLIIGGDIPDFEITSVLLSFIPTFLITFFLGGAVSEEFGWRGYALDRLQSKYNPLISSLLLGVVWGIWHLPLFYMIGTSQASMSFFLFLVNTLFLTILFTWIYNKTNRNIMSTILFHTMTNVSWGLFPLILLPKGFISVIIVMFILDMFILLTGNLKNLPVNQEETLSL